MAIGGPHDLDLAKCAFMGLDVDEVDTPGRQSSFNCVHAPEVESRGEIMCAVVRRTDIGDWGVGIIC